MGYLEGYREKGRGREEEGRENRRRGEEIDSFLGFMGYLEDLEKR